VCWMSTEPMSMSKKYVLKHTTRPVRMVVRSVHYRLNINTLHREEGIVELGLNEIGRVTIRTQSPLFFDEYRRCRQTGSFIIIDEATNSTVGVGMINGPAI
jgi:bifunctional enzyme CysN/CysC